MFVKKRAARKGWVFAMKKKTLYIVTGAAGHLGGTIVRLLHKRRLPVRGFLRLGETPPVAGVPYVYGDVRDADSLRPLFADVMEERVVVIHTAGIVGIADAPDPVMHDVNVNGTSIVASLCLEYGARMVYVSSVHAIPENGGLRVLTETDSFSPDTVQGWYAKSKAEATRNVLAAVREKGLDAVVVHPSGIIGPFTEDNHLVQLIGDYIDGSLPACVRGGYDFVDVPANAIFSRTGITRCVSCWRSRAAAGADAGCPCCRRGWRKPPCLSSICMPAFRIADRCTLHIPSTRCKATTVFRTTRLPRSLASSRGTFAAPWRTRSRGCAAGG